MASCLPLSCPAFSNTVISFFSWDDYVSFSSSSVYLSGLSTQGTMIIGSTTSLIMSWKVTLIGKSILPSSSADSSSPKDWTRSFRIPSTGVSLTQPHSVWKVAPSAGSIAISAGNVAPSSFRGNYHASGLTHEEHLDDWVLGCLAPASSSDSSAAFLADFPSRGCKFGGSICGLILPCREVVWWIHVYFLPHLAAED